MRRILILAAIFAVLATASRAQSPLMFSPEQFNTVDLVQTQSAGVRALESLGSHADRFEPINMLGETSKYRRIARAVGRLKILASMPNGSRGVLTCTAALIARDLLITNYHCVPGINGERIEQVKVDFLYVELGSTTIQSFAVNRAPLEADRALDYAVLQLPADPPIPPSILPVPLTFRHVSANESLFLIHHPAGQPQRLTRAFCRPHASRAIEGTELFHLCDTLPGSSGALIFADDDLALVGIHHSGGLSPIDSSSFNRGTNAIALRSGSKILAERAALLTNPPAGDYGVQISSQRSVADSFNAFANLQKRFPELKGKIPGIVEVDMQDRGKFYRIIIGPPMSREAATALCSQLKIQGGVECFVSQMPKPATTR